MVFPYCVPCAAANRRSATPPGTEPPGIQASPCPSTGHLAASSFPQPLNEIIKLIQNNPLSELAKNSFSRNLHNRGTENTNTDEFQRALRLLPLPGSENNTGIIMQESGQTPGILFVNGVPKSPNWTPILPCKRETRRRDTEREE